MATILLTGGTGFFGRALLRYWLTAPEKTRENLRITMLSRNPSEFLRRYPLFDNHDWLSFHASDVLQPQTLPVSEKFTHILHAATDSAIGSQLSKLHRFSQIVDGTRNILQ